MPETTSVVRVSCDGTTYDIDFTDLTAIDAKDFRREVGIPLMSVLSNQEQPDLDVIAGLIWLARRKGEPTLTFTEVATAINWSSDVDLLETQQAEAATPEV